MTTATFGSIVYGFFLDYLPQQKGLRSSTIRSYRDTVRLFLSSVAADARRGVSDLRVEDLSFERVLGFLRELEQTRHNGVPTRMATENRSWGYTRIKGAMANLSSLLKFDLQKSGLRLLFWQRFS